MLLGCGSTLCVSVAELLVGHPLIVAPGTFIHNQAVATTTQLSKMMTAAPLTARVACRATTMAVCRVGLSSKTPDAGAVGDEVSHQHNRTLLGLALPCAGHSSSHSRSHLIQIL